MKLELNTLDSYTDEELERFSGELRSYLVAIDEHRHREHEGDSVPRCGCAPCEAHRTAEIQRLVAVSPLLAADAPWRSREAV